MNPVIFSATLRCCSLHPSVWPATRNDLNKPTPTSAPRCFRQPAQRMAALPRESCRSIKAPSLSCARAWRWSAPTGKSPTPP